MAGAREHLTASGAPLLPAGPPPRAPGHPGGVHQAGEGLPAGHHLHRGAEETPHAAVLHGQERAGASPRPGRAPGPGGALSAEGLRGDPASGTGVRPSDRGWGWTCKSHSSGTRARRCMSFVRHRDDQRGGSEKEPVSSRGDGWRPRRVQGDRADSGGGGPEGSSGGTVRGLGRR